MLILHFRVANRHHPLGQENSTHRPYDLLEKIVDLGFTIKAAGGNADANRDVAIYASDLSAGTERIVSFGRGESVEFALGQAVAVCSLRAVGKDISFASKAQYELRGRLVYEPQKKALPSVLDQITVDHGLSIAKENDAVLVIAGDGKSNGCADFTAKAIRVSDALGRLHPEYRSLPSGGRAGEIALRAQVAWIEYTDGFSWAMGVDPSQVKSPVYRFTEAPL